MILPDFSRSELLLGVDNMKALKESSVCIAGLGGVGSYAAETLARSGVGRFTLIDFDVASASNINRQIIATVDTIGIPKATLMRKRIHSINPLAIVETHAVFLDETNRMELTEEADYIIDAIDSLGPKIGLLEDLSRSERRFISVMGAGNRLDPTKIHIAPLKKSYNCPLARRVRKFLRRRGIKGDFPCVFSSELPILPDSEIDFDAEITIQRGRQRPG